MLLGEIIGVKEMICKNCGKELKSDESIFCTDCEDEMNNLASNLFWHEDLWN